MNPAALVALMWIAAQLMRHREPLACHLLRLAGFETYAPLLGASRRVALPVEHVLATP